MNLSKKDWQEDIKTNVRLFKSSDKKNMSLTHEGLLELSKRQTVYTLTFKEIKTKDIINLSKVFKTPYYVSHKNNTLYHFDELINVQSIFYKDDIGLLLDSFL